MNEYPLLLTRQQAAHYLGIDPKSFDKYFRQNPNFKCFMIGKNERYTKIEIRKFVKEHCTN